MWPVLVPIRLDGNTHSLFAPFERALSASRTRSLRGTNRVDSSETSVLPTSQAPPVFPLALFRHSFRHFCRHFCRSTLYRAPVFFCAAPLYQLAGVAIQFGLWGRNGRQLHSQFCVVEARQALHTFVCRRALQRHPERGPKAALVRRWKNMAGRFHPGPLRN
jgi:hypothetical protein